MTHTLHRQGTERSLRNDAIVFAMSAKGLNEDGSAPKLRRFLEILLRHGPVNFGDMKTGNRFVRGVEEILAGVQDTSIVHGVFADWDEVPHILEEVRDADLGMSVIVTGLFRSAEDCCRRAGLARHTVEYSLGVKGKAELLPEDDILAVTTMCGHGMVPANLVRKMLVKVKRGDITAEAAGVELAKPCQCGVFNNVRAAELLERLAAVYSISGV